VNIAKKLGAAGLVAAALTAAAIVAPTAAFADSSAPPAVGSGAGQTDVALYVLNGETGEPYAQGTSLSYGISLVGGPSATDPEQAIPAPTGGAANAFSFISPRGQERDYTKWNAMSDLGPGTDQSLVPIGPSQLITTGQGTPAGTAAVAATGGDYSVGVAWVSQNVIKKVAFTYISVVPGNIATTTFTFAQPVSAPVGTAPTITTASLDALTQGAAFSQTLAATGDATISWSVQAGALPAGLNLNATTGVISGTPSAAGAYDVTVRATNTAGTNDKKFTGTVNAPVPTAPTEPTGNAAGKVTIAAPAAGATTVTIPGAVAGQTYNAWAWSTPTQVGNLLVADTNGNVVVDITSLPAGTHTVALTSPGDATYAVKFWGTFEKLANAGDPLTDTVDLKATVTASDLWSLNAEQTAVDFGNVARGGNSTKPLGKVTVVDDRAQLKGWNLKAENTAFTKGADSIPASALEIAPKPFNNGTLATGITAGTNGATFATSAPLVSTGTAGALFDAELKFTAPSNANAGEYHSTLTLTLTSK
jgi:hypothetical protein